MERKGGGFGSVAHGESDEQVGEAGGASERAGRRGGSPATRGGRSFDPALQREELQRVAPVDAEEDGDAEDAVLGGGGAWWPR